MNWNDLAQNILDNVGGTSNVKNATHCATRLRLTLYDDSKADKDKIDKLSGVLGVVNQGGQLQVIIGNDFPKAYDAFMNVYKSGGVVLEDESKTTEKEKEKKKKRRSRYLLH